MKKIAISQSNYIPWKGYFDLINSVDEFVLYDDMQYTKRDWRNRNKIKTAHGIKWLTIPVNVKGKYFQKINETIVSDNNWSKSHWDTIKHCYSKAPYFNDYKSGFEELYLNLTTANLSEINYEFIKLINQILSISTNISLSSDYELAEDRTERLLSICKQSNSNYYLSGPSAKEYFDESLAKKMGIKIIWFDYTNYPEYRQINGPFEHGVTILDLIFNEGPNAIKYMKSF